MNLAGRDSVFDRIALGVDQPQRAIGEFNRLVFVDQAHVERREVGEDLDLRLEGFCNLLVPADTQAEIRIGFGQHGQDFVALCRGQRLGHAARHNPTRVDALVAEQLDDVLPKAAQSDAGASQLRLGGRDTPKMLRTLGSASMPITRSGEER